MEIPFNMQHNGCLYLALELLAKLPGDLRVGIVIY